MFGFKRKAAVGPSVAEVIAAVAQGDMVLLDVRDHAEVAQSGKARGAVHVPLMRLAMMADPRHPDFNAVFAQDKPVAVYCASGARSAMAANVLAKLGYGAVHNLGGLKHWIAAGGPVSRGS